MILLPAVRTEVLVVRVVAPEALQALALELNRSLAVRATDVQEDVCRCGRGHVDAAYPASGHAFCPRLNRPFDDGVRFGRVLIFVPRGRNGYEPQASIAAACTFRRAGVSGLSGFEPESRQLPGQATVFSQGDAADDVLYIQDGSVRLSVLSKSGREAVIAMLDPGDFFGEGCLAGQPVRMGTATAVTPTRVLAIAKPEIIRLLHEQPSSRIAS